MKVTVATPSPMMKEAKGKRRLCRALMGGTSAMIAAGQEFLPAHPGEVDGTSVNLNYQTRLKCNILTNFLEQAISKQVGKIFSKPVALQDDVPADIAALCENIDRQGRGLHSFFFDVAKGAFTDGIGYVLADYPIVQGVQTLADEKALGARPYAIHIDADNLIECMSEQINGIETITRVRIKETTSIPADDFSYVVKDQIRVLKREPNGAITYEIWEENENKTDWVKVQEGATTLPRIPLVPFYTNRTGFMMGEPPNQSTAELNLRHWRSMSEQINALSFQRFAMLSAVGIADDSIIKIGPSKLLTSTNPEATFAFVEPTGKGVEMGRLDLESIEKAIESATATLRVERAGTVTATAAAIDSAESNAGLKAIAQGFKDSIETLLMYFGEMMNKGTDAAGSVYVNDDFGTKKGTDAGLQELGKIRALGDISRESYLAELVRRGELDEEFDADVDAELLSAEPPKVDQVL